MPLQRFEASSLEAALEEARTIAGPSGTVIEANRLRRGGIAGFFAKERYEVAVEVDGRAGRADTPVPADVSSLLSLTEAADRADEVVRSPVGAAPAASATVAATGDVSTERADFAELLTRLAREASPSPVEVPTVPSVAIGVERALEATPARPAARPGALARLGLPASLVPSGAIDDLAHDLLRALASLPKHEPLPSGDGTVVAVVGAREEALAVARTLADGLGLDPASVALAAEDDSGEGIALGCLLPSAMAVSEARWAARFRSGPSVVAVVAPVGCNGGSWGRRALEALEPTTVWAAVDAGRKPEDVEVWSDGLGGVDALAVSGLEATSSPASILAAGIPVARLDGHPASPSLWTALILERMAA